MRPINCREQVWHAHSGQNFISVFLLRVGAAHLDWNQLPPSTPGGGVGRKEQSRIQGGLGTSPTSGSRGAWAPLPPRFFFQNHAVFRQFAANCGLRKLRWAPLTKIVDPPLSSPSRCLTISLHIFSWEAKNVEALWSHNRVSQTSGLQVSTSESKTLYLSLCRLWFLCLPTLTRKKLLQTTVARI